MAWLVAGGLPILCETSLPRAGGALPTSQKEDRGGGRARSMDLSCYSCCRGFVPGLFSGVLGGSWQKVAPWLIQSHTLLINCVEENEALEAKCLSWARLCV